MQVNKILYEAIQANNNMITTEQAVRLGFTRSLLSLYVQKGLLQRVRHGVYTLPGEEGDPLYILMLRSERIVFSHGTALFLNGVIPQLPKVLSVTVPTDSGLRRNLQADCICHYVRPELQRVGLEYCTSPMGNTLACYNMERTVCDYLRCRSTVTEQETRQAISLYLQWPHAQPARLEIYAQQFKVEKRLKRYLKELQQPAIGTK